MASVIRELDSFDLPRLRVGIGRPEGTGDVIGWVLADFSAAEKHIMEDMYPLVARAIECFAKEGITSAMNRFNALEVGV
jgi:PTH1 family peptidyl-tRNA hydrolase